MLVTDEEAETKWCPFTRDAGGANRHGHGSGDEVRCIGSDCMAWRWFDSMSDDGTACHHKPTVHTPRVPEPPLGRPLTDRRGYCGLAGEPQR